MGGAFFAKTFQMVLIDVFEVKNSANKRSFSAVTQRLCDEGRQQNQTAWAETAANNDACHECHRQP